MTLSRTVFTISGVPVSLFRLICWGIALLALYILFISFVLEKDPRIRIFKAFRTAFRVGGHQFGGLIKFLVVEICVMLICLVPLFFLLEKSIRFLAALVIPMWILIMNPIRMNAAVAMQDALNGGQLFTARLLETEGWWRKVWNGLKRALFLAIWTVPLAAGMYYGYRLWKGADDMDGFTLLQSIQDFGGGDVTTGIVYISMIVMGLVMFLWIGVAFHSGARHAHALGISRKLRSHHGKIVFGWLISWIILWPVLITMMIMGGAVQSVMMDVNGIVTETVKIPNIRILLGIVGAGALLTLPLIPFRSLVTASMVNQLKEKDEEENAAP